MGDFRGGTLSNFGFWDILEIFWRYFGDILEYLLVSDSQNMCFFCVSYFTGKPAAGYSVSAPLSSPEEFGVGPVFDVLPTTSTLHGIFRIFHSSHMGTVQTCSKYGHESLVPLYFTIDHLTIPYYPLVN